MNADVVDRRGMLAVTCEVVSLIAVIDTPRVSASHRAFIKVLKVALCHEVINVVWILSVWKCVLIKCVLVNPQVVKTNVKL